MRQGKSFFTRIREDSLLKLPELSQKNIVVQQEAIADSVQEYCEVKSEKYNENTRQNDTASVFTAEVEESKKNEKKERENDVWESKKSRQNALEEEKACEAQKSQAEVESKKGRVDNSDFNEGEIPKELLAEDFIKTVGDYINGVGKDGLFVSKEELGETADFYFWEDKSYGNEHDVVTNFENLTPKKVDPEFQKDASLERSVAKPSRLETEELTSKPHTQTNAGTPKPELREANQGVYSTLNKSFEMTGLSEGGKVDFVSTSKINHIQNTHIPENTKNRLNIEEVKITVTDRTSSASATSKNKAENAGSIGQSKDITSTYESKTYLRSL